MVQRLLAVALVVAVPAVAGDDELKRALSRTASTGDDDSTLKSAHEKVTQACGHDVAVKIDWSGFQLADWQRKDLIPWLCVVDQLDALAGLCSVATYQDYKSPAAGVKSITCKGKPAAELPRSTPPTVGVSGGTQKDKSPGRGFVLSEDQSNLEVSICPKSDVGEKSAESEHAGYTALGFLLQAFTTDALWRAQMERSANEGGSSESPYQDLKDRHQSVTADCGHDVAVKIDWAGFTRSEWATPFGVRSMLPVTCAYEVLAAMSRACTDARFKKADVAAIKTITCHGKPDAQLPRSSPPTVSLSGGTQKDKGPGRELGWKRGAANIDVSFCRKSDSGDTSTESEVAGYSAFGFFRKALKVK